MKKYIFLLSIILLLHPSCTNNNIIYPDTDIIPVAESYYGDKILDNYRWLEDDRSEKTIDWVKRQNNTTFKYLNQINQRNIQSSLYFDQLVQGGHKFLLLAY